MKKMSDAHAVEIAVDENMPRIQFCLERSDDSGGSTFSLAGKDAVNPSGVSAPRSRTIRMGRNDRLSITYIGPEKDAE